MTSDVTQDPKTGLEPVVIAAAIGVALFTTLWAYLLTMFMGNTPLAIIRHGLYFVCPWGAVYYAAKQRYLAVALMWAINAGFVLTFQLGWDFSALLLAPIALATWPVIADVRRRRAAAPIVLAR